MTSTPHFPFRLARGLSASTLCWLMLGLAGACAAFAALPETAKARPTSAATTVAPTSNGKAQRELRFPSSADPYQPGGPGVDDDTEWMPGAR